MLQDVHTRKESIAVAATSDGDNTVIAADANAWIYVHELIGDLDVAGTMSIKAGSRILATFALDAGQGITLQDEPGEDNRPRFECRPGEAFIINMSAGSDFRGAAHYSKRN